MDPSSDSDRGDAEGWTPQEWGQVEDFICFLQLHLLWVAFSSSSIPFPIKLNSLLTGVPHGNGVDGIRRDSSLPLHPPYNNHRSLLSKSAGNGVWTLRISSVYPFYLFLICINGNSVCFNLCDGTGCRAEEVPFFYPISHWGGDILFWLLFGKTALAGGECLLSQKVPSIGFHQSTSCLHQIQG